jgi:hypothetical protein
MMRSIDDKYRTIANNVILAYCLTLMLTFNKTVKIVDFKSFLELFQADSIITTVLFLFSFYFLQKNKSEKINRRENRIITIFSIILALIHIVGSDITYTQSTLRGVVGRYSIVSFLILVTISFVAIKKLLVLLYNRYNKVELVGIKEKQVFNKLLYFKMLIPFLLIRILGFIVFFPGVTTWDSMYIIGEGLGYYPLSNSHPYVYTLFVSLFTKLGWKFFGGVGIGVAIFNFVTLVFTSVTVVYVLYKIFETFEINIWLKRGLYIFYTFFPNFIVTSFTMYKDTFLMNFLMIFFLCMVMIMYKSEEFFNSRYSLIIFVVSFFGVYMLHRKAVIYIVVGMIAILIYSKTNRLKVMKYVGIALIITLTLNSIGNLVFKPTESKFKYDYLSTRFQQLAAAVYYHPESFTKEELEFYDSTLGLENNKNFTYHIADPIKQKMKNEQFQGKSDKFFEIWWKGYKKHPKTYIDAVLNLSVSYWYPYNYADIAYVSNYYYSMYKGNKNWFDDDRVFDSGWNFNYPTKTFNKVYDKFYNLHWNIGELSFVGSFYRAGLYALGLMVMLLLTILRNNKVMIPLIFITISVVLTCIFSPLANYFRYSYIYIMLVPMLIPMLFVKTKIKT